MKIAKVLAIGLAIEIIGLAASTNAAERLVIGEMFTSTT